MRHPASTHSDAAECLEHSARNRRKKLHCKSRQEATAELDECVGDCDLLRNSSNLRNSANNLAIGTASALSSFSGDRRWPALVAVGLSVADDFGHPSRFFCALKSARPVNPTGQRQEYCAAA